MEVDWCAVDEYKEGGDGALLHADDSSDGGSSDFPMQIDHGQMQIVHLRQLPPSCNRR
jgi:hypothetical protein